MSVAVIPTRERLLQAARSVVEETGYGGASVAVIARRAEVSNGALYRHFPSKAELFIEVFRAVCAHEVAAMQRAVAEQDAPVEQTLAALDVFARRALTNRTLAWALLAEPVDPLVDVVRLEYRRTYRDLLAQPLRRAVEAGALPPQDAELTATALVGAAGELLVGPVSPAGAPDRTPEQVLRELQTICRRAMGASVVAAPSLERRRANA